MSSGGRIAELASLVRRMLGHRIAVLGDPVLDCYLYGHTHRISREAPVLVVREDHRAYRLGGAANVAANLSALGARAQLIGLVGHDEAGRELTDLALKAQIDTSRLAVRNQGCTITKTRVLAGGLHTRKQQMLRIDRENPKSAHAQEDEGRILQNATDAFAHADAVVVSDYGDGSLTPTYAHLASLARESGRIVVVDSRHALTNYRGVTAVTPNEPEVEEALGISLADAQEAKRAAVRITEDLGLDVTLLTRGREGMIVAAQGQGPVQLVAHGGHEAVDVTGAGDTVAATFALALTAGAPILDAAILANCSASVVIKTVGTATCSLGELLAALEEFPQ